MSLSLEVDLNLAPPEQNDNDDTPEKPVCEYCRSDQVTFDASAYWDAQHQEFDFDILKDEVYCQNCDGKQRVDWIPL